MQPAFVVRPYRPWRTRIVAVIIIGTLVALAYLLYGAGFAAGRGEYLVLRGDRDSVLGMNRHLRERVDLLERALETTTTDTQVRANAYAELIRALGQQQRKLVELREEAAFFKNLATKEPVQGEFRIRNLSVSRGSEPRRFNARLVLTNTVPKRVQSDVQVSLTILGQSPAGAVSLPLDSVSDLQERLTFSFTRYGVTDVELSVPDNVEPRRTIVRVWIREGEAARLVASRSFLRPNELKSDIRHF